MTVREELQKLGPDAVRRAMVAFEHRAGSRGFFSGAKHCPDRSIPCCFLLHAVAEYKANAITQIFHDFPTVEDCFEGRLGSPGDRESLRLECIAFLAEHGDAVEIAPKKSPRALRVAALLCLLLLVLVV